jgi:ribosomal protein S2
MRVNSLSPKQLINCSLHLGQHRRDWVTANEIRFAGYRSKIAIFDLAQTATYLNRALNFLERSVKLRRKGYFLGPSDKFYKNEIRGFVKLGQTVSKKSWTGGILSNRHQLKKFVANPKNNLSFVASSFLNEQNFSIVSEALSNKIPLITPLDSNVTCQIIPYPIPGGSSNDSAKRLFINLYLERAYKGYLSGLSLRKADHFEERSRRPRKKVSPKRFRSFRAFAYNSLSYTSKKKRKKVSLLAYKRYQTILRVLNNFKKNTRLYSLVLYRIFLVQRNFSKKKPKDIYESRLIRKFIKMFIKYRYNFAFRGYKKEYDENIWIKIFRPKEFPADKPAVDLTEKTIREARIKRAYNRLFGYSDIRYKSKRRIKRIRSAPTRFLKPGCAKRLKKKKIIRRAKIYTRILKLEIKKRREARRRWHRERQAEIEEYRSWKGKWQGPK